MDNENGIGLRRRGAITVFLRSRGAFPILLFCALIVGGFPVLLSIFAPQLNNSVVLVLCASGQFFVSIFAGIAWSKADALKEANTRWVPMAASACDRLATILGSVANLRATVGQACSAASRNLPELNEDRNRAVRIHFEGLCSSNATRLNDVENHLDSALTDWERFIKHNCDGPECADIGRRLAILRARLSSKDSGSGTLGCGTIANDRPTDLATLQQTTEQLNLMVSGVTTDPKLNGRWALRRIDAGFWECERYVLRKVSDGWFVEDRNNSNSYFFRAGTSSQCGVYDRCVVCPYDGRAVVFYPVDALSDSLPANGDARSVSSSAAPGNVQSKFVLNFAFALDQYLQHANLNHGVSKEMITAAITEANNMEEYSAMLGIECPNVVSVCALATLNAVREFLGRPVFEFDSALHTRLCAKITNAGDPTKSHAGESSPNSGEPDSASSDEGNKAA